MFLAVNIYGWKRIGTGKNRGGYFHPSFVQGIPELCLLLKRAPLPEDKDSEDPVIAPCLRSLVECTNTSMSLGRKNAPLGMDDIYQNPRNPLLANFNVQIPSEAFQMQKDFNFRGMTSYNDQYDPFGVRGLDSFSHTNANMNMNTTPRVYVGGTGRMSEDMHLFADLFHPKDFQIEEQKNFRSLVPLVRDVFEDNNYIRNDKLALSDMESPPGACENVFPQKLHFLLQQAEMEGFDHIISWVNDGAAFKVHDSKAFLEKVMPNYFDQSKFESFRRQLNLYGFQRVSRGPSRGIYYHQFFLQSEPSLCQSITRPVSTSASSAIRC